MDELEDDINKVSPVPLLIKFNSVDGDVLVMFSGTVSENSEEVKLNLWDAIVISDEPEEKFIEPTEVKLI